MQKAVKKRPLIFSISKGYSIPSNNENNFEIKGIHIVSNHILCYVNTELKYPKYIRMNYLGTIGRYPSYPNLYQYSSTLNISMVSEQQHQ